MNRFSLQIVAFFAVMLTSFVALATDAVVEQAWWQTLISHLLQIVTTIFVPVLSVLAVVLAKRWGVSIELDTVDKILDKAVGFAEQKALNALKEGKPKSSSAEKLDWALTMARDMAKRYKLSVKATSKLQDLIEAKLGQKKLEAATPAEPATASDKPPIVPPAPGSQPLV